MFGYQFQRRNATRQQLYIDNGLQATVLRRIFLYAFAALVYFVIILAVDVWMHQPELSVSQFLLSFFDQAIYWAPGLIAIGPVIAYDMLRLSNRFAGPVFSISREMTRLAEGENVAPLSFRDEDHWHSLAESFNEIRDELARYRETGTPEERVSMNDPSRPSIPPRERLFNEDDEDEADELADVLA